METIKEDKTVEFIVRQRADRKTRKTILPNPCSEYKDFICGCCGKDVWYKPNKENICSSCESLLKSFDNTPFFKDFLENGKNEKIMILTYKLIKAEEKIHRLEEKLNKN